LRASIYQITIRITAYGRPNPLIEIDGSAGEGGGQIVRTALALAMCTRSPVTLRKVRANRSKPGLRAQHLAAVRAAAAICAARVDGATTASTTLRFEPGAVRPGRYEIDVGTAGSALLVLQTILPALAFCKSASEVLIQGGTHNPRAPTFEFIRDAYLPLIARIGFRAELSLQRHGFYPRGGGLVRALIEPFRGGNTLRLLGRGALRTRTAGVLLSRLPAHIAEREIAVLRLRLGLSASACSIDTVDAPGVGNTVHVRVDCAHVTTVFCGFGMRGVPAETVAGRLADEVVSYLDSDVALDVHLADQVLLPLALASGGQFSTLAPSGHTRTNAAVISTFLPIAYEEAALGSNRWRIGLRRDGRAAGQQG